MTRFQHLIDQAPEIEKKIGYSFKDRQLLALAFVHRSFVNENRTVTQHNERLEFLGDSVLGIIISDYLYRSLSTIPEGELTYLRSRIVEASSCYHFIKLLNVESYILLGKGERLNDGRGRESILANLFEAILGAIYLDGGIEAATHFLFSNYSDQIEAIIKTPMHNWKALLQDYCQRHYQETPTYRVDQESGPDHSKQFTITVEIKEKALGRGQGSSKKEAQQAAAADAMTHLR